MGFIGAFGFVRVDIFKELFNTTDLYNKCLSSGDGDLDLYQVLGFL